MTESFTTSLTLFFAWLLAQIALFGIVVRRRAGSTRPRQVRLGETLIVVGLGGAWVALIVVGNESTPPLWNRPNMPSHIQAAHVRLLQLAITQLILTGVFVARGYFQVALGLTIPTMLAVSSMADTQDRDALAILGHLNSRVENGAPRDPAQYGLEPTNAVIQTVGNIEGAELWLNGEMFGTTPFVMPYSEFQRRVRSHQQGSHQARDSSFSTDFIDIRSRLDLRFNAFILSDRFEVRNENERGMFFGFGWTSGGYPVERRDSGAIRTYDVVMHVTFPSWEYEIDHLLERARLLNYDVNDAWISAIASYRQRGWWRLRDAAVTEPAFDAILDRWATWQYKIDTRVTQHQVWALVEQIGQEADEIGRFEPDSPAGRALEILSDRVDPQRLVDACKHAMGESSDWGALTVHRPSRILPDRGVRSTITSPNPRRRSDDGSLLRASHTVLEQLIQRVDQHLDSLDDSLDNIVERELTPRLMRRAAKLGAHPERFDGLATLLGGSTYESAVFRHYMTMATRAPRSPRLLEPTSRDEVRALLAVASLRSRFGREFREKHRKMLCWWVRKSRKEPPFLLLPTANGVPIIVDLWSDILTHAAVSAGANSSMASVVMTLEAFGAVAPDDLIIRTIEFLAKHRRTYGLNSTLFKLSPERRDRIMSAVVASGLPTFEERLRHYSLANWLSTVPSHAAASAAWEQFHKSADGNVTENYIKYAVEFRMSEIASRNPAPHFLMYVAEHGPTALRREVVNQLQVHLTPARIRVLEKLAADPDEDVRSAARKLLERHQKLPKQPLPSSGLDPVGVF